MITVKYLASLAEQLGKSEETLTFSQVLTVAEAWTLLNPDYPMPANTICAINFDYASLESPVADNSELAFFPPVTGG